MLRLGIYIFVPPNPRYIFCLLSLFMSRSNCKMTNYHRSRRRMSSVGYRQFKHSHEHLHQKLQLKISVLPCISSLSNLLLPRKAFDGLWFPLCSTIAMADPCFRLTKKRFGFMSVLCPNFPPEFRNALHILYLLLNHRIHSAIAFLGKIISCDF